MYFAWFQKKKKLLFLYTSLADWFLYGRRSVFTAWYDLRHILHVSNENKTHVTVTGRDISCA